MATEPDANLPEELQAALHFISCLEQLRVPYLIGGSIASAIHGEPRATNDVDFSADLHPEHVVPLVSALGDSYYASEEAIRRAVGTGRSFNVIHLATYVKIDVFVVGNDAVARHALTRRQATVVGKNKPRELYVATPEDIVVRKLAWFRLGGETSDRQWRDVVGVLRVQSAGVDQGYLAKTARALGVEDLLARAQSESAKPWPDRASGSVVQQPQG